MLLKPLLFVALAVVTLAVVTVPCPADAAARTRTRAAASKPPVPLLWKVSDADNDVYLLGSFHMLKPSDYPLSADVDAAFDDAESLAFELPPEEVLSPELGLAMARSALRKTGTPLNSDLSEATAAKLTEWTDVNSDQLQAAGLSTMTLQMFDPWFVGLTISVIEMKKAGLDANLGLDMHFIERAHETSKPTAGLETGQEQIAVFQTMSQAEQLQFLEESMSETDGAQGELDKLHDAWRRGDQAVLWDGMASSMRRDYPKLYQRINVARNEAWVPRLQRMLDDEASHDTLVVVGALHLLGDDGVVAKLRAKGYRVERICSACAQGAKP